jgi:hypothetical protein
VSLKKRIASLTNELGPSIGDVGEGLPVYITLLLSKTISVLLNPDVWTLYVNLLTIIL